MRLRSARPDSTRALSVSTTLRLSNAFFFGSDAAATTCSEFLDLGGRRDDLKHDLAKGFVVVVGPWPGPPPEDKALDAEVAGLLAGGDDALLTISL